MPVAATTVVAPIEAADSRAMNVPLKDIAANLRTRGPVGVTVAEPLEALADVNGRMNDLEQYLANTDIAWPPKPGAPLPTGPKTITRKLGNLTVALEYHTERLVLRYSVTLNGSVTGNPPLYKNFVFCDGSVRLDRLDGKEGYHQTATYYQLRDGGTTGGKLALAENWIFADRSGQGSQQVLLGDGAFFIYKFNADRNWEWTAYTGKDVTTYVKRAHIKVNAAKDGMAEVFCKTDGKVRANATWNANKTGQVCAFVTACSDRDGCVAFPRS